MECIELDRETLKEMSSHTVCDAITKYFKTNGEHGSLLYNTLRYMAIHSVYTISDSHNNPYTFDKLVRMFMASSVKSIDTMFDIAMCIVMSGTQIKLIINTAIMLLFHILKIDSKYSNAYYLLGLVMPSDRASIMINNKRHTRTTLFFIAFLLDCTNYDKAITLALNMKSSDKITTQSKVITAIDLMKYAIKLNRSRIEAYYCILLILYPTNTVVIDNVEYTYDDILSIIISLMNRIK